jgi:hypothetical protein
LHKPQVDVQDERLGPQVILSSTDTSAVCVCVACCCCCQRTTRQLLQGSHTLPQPVIHLCGRCTVLRGPFAVRAPAAASSHITAWDTAAASSVPVSHVAKTMTLLVDATPHLVVTLGDQRVDMHKARTHLRCCQPFSQSTPHRQPALPSAKPRAATAAPAVAAPGCGPCQPARSPAPVLPQRLLGAGYRLLRLKPGLTSAGLPVAAARLLL